jgi:hypothetical protein
MEAGSYYNFFVTVRQPTQHHISGDLILISISVRTADVFEVFLLSYM